MRATQQKILDLLAELGAEVSLADFQGLLFLHCRREALPRFEFVPAPRGAYSFTAAAELEKLVNAGHVTRSGQAIRLGEGREKEPQRGALDPALRLRGDELEAAVRAQLPAVDSVHTGGPRLYTIGYEGRSLEAYLNALLAAKVTTLCDVRKNALSRKFGFSKRTLQRACADVGLGYRHLPELGIDSELRRSLVTQADYDALFERYARTTLAAQAEAVKELGSSLAAGEAIALTCYERLPEQCHRQSLGIAMQTICRLTGPLQHS